MSSLEAALTAAQHGYQIIRLRPGSKVPAGPWRGHETTDANVIRSWYANGANPNYGIVADRSGLVILDEDTPGDLERWADDNSTTLPATRTVTTGRGTHYYFHDNGHEYGNETPFRRDGYDIDVRGHGFVVGPGSLHAETGVLYSADNTPLATVPQALHNYLTGGAESAPDPPEKPVSTPSTADLIGRCSWQETAVRGVLDDLQALQAVPLGHAPRWDRTVYALACRLIELSNYDPDAYPLDRAHADFHEHAPRDDTFNTEQHRHKWDAALRQVGTTAAQPADRTPAPVTHEATVTDDGDLFTPLEWAGLLAGPPPAEDWLLWPLIERGQSVSLYSAPKVGKSLTCLEFVGRASAGQAVLGHTPDRPLRTLYIDAENTRRDIKARLHALNLSAHDLRNLDYLSFPPIRPLDTPAGALDMHTLAKRHNPDLIVIDTISRFIDGGENDSDTWLAVYANTLRHLKAEGIGVLRLDHEGKDGDRGERGSSAKNGDVDASWRLTYDENKRTRTLTRKLTRTGNGPERIVLDVQSDPLRHEMATPLRTDPAAPVVAALDALDVPTEWGRGRVSRALSDGGYSFRNEHISAAIKVRKNRPETCPQDSENEKGRGQVWGQVGTAKPVPEHGDSSDITPGETCPRDSGTGSGQSPRTDLSPASLPIRDAVGTGVGMQTQMRQQNDPDTDAPEGDDAELFASLDAAAAQLEWGRP